jgi:hypothetical protein
MKPAKIRYKIAKADSETMALVVELIGKPRLALQVVQDALEGTNELPDIEVLAKLLKMSKSGARKRAKKSPPKI